MNPEKLIHINPDIPLLNKYFKWPVITKGGKPWVDWTIKKKYYDQVYDLLSDYGAHDQKAIDTFCFLEMIISGMHWTAKGQDFKNSDGIWRKYYLDHSKFGKFIEEFNIESIHFTGNDKATGGRNTGSVTFNDPQFIKDIFEELSDMMEWSKSLYNDGYGEIWKRRPGAETKHSGKFIWVTFSNLRKFLHGLHFPELNDLSEREENYFAGRLFGIAGVIEAFPDQSEDKTAYKSEKDYLVKRMQKFR